MVRTLIGLLLVVVLSGCSSLHQVAREESKIPITVENVQEKVKEAGAVFLWPPYSSAAIVDKSGDRCVLAASGAKTATINTEGALKLADALEKVKGLEASFKNSLVEAFTKTSAADSKAAFTDVALFHLCVLEMNGNLKDAKPEKRKAMLDAFYKVLDTARELR
jgi:hypothetical protein